MTLPDYIDNSKNTLQSALENIINEKKQLILDIATGYFRIEAWIKLESSMNQLTSLRLLIGRDPAIIPGERDRIDLLRYFRRDIQNQLEKEDFRPEYKKKIDRMIAYLEQEHIQVRLFGATTGEFLHAKAYIFNNYSIVGSSNFTPAGLTGNTELNVVNKIQAIASDLKVNWFNNLWEHESVDIEYKTKLIETLNASKFGSKAYTPYQVFMKALYEMFKDDIVIDSDRSSLELADFQQEGFKRAIKLITEHNGCMVADAVGLGKTYIGLRILEYYLTNLRKPGFIPRALVVCPAQLRDLVWRQKTDDFGIKVTIVSHEEISRKDFNVNLYNSYDIVVVDESHNFRNSATNRYENLLKLISNGKKNKRVVLLTATPINNSIYDLYHQILLIARGDNTYYQDWGISNLKSYFNELNKGKKEIVDLLFQTMVRRSRQDIIRRQQAGEEIRINGKLIHFPKRQLEKITYNFEETFTGLYANIANKINQLNLFPYNITEFKNKKDDDDDKEIKRNNALVALQKALYLKRFESSLIAFKNTIVKQKDFQANFINTLKQGKILDSKSFRRFVLATDEESSNEIIENLEDINIKDYDIELLEDKIEIDLRILNDILNILKDIEFESKQHINKDYDRKLLAFKDLLTNLKGEKILVFTYFKDTANYLHTELTENKEWLAEISVNGNIPIIELLTGETPARQREEKVKRFSPKANTKNEEDLKAIKNPIDILICTDVLSEGQNLQDARILINYDLHWNPVRMIQRAGRIDRLGTDYDELLIYNCFPEEGLESLLNLVKRLQKRISDIDREVGLDGSILGETISEKSLEELIKLKQADSDSEKQAILEELEELSDLISLEEMRLPLLEFFQKASQDIIEEIPFGIHSTWDKNIKYPHQDISNGGVFLAFRVNTQHFWHFYPRINGAISLDKNNLISDKRSIFNWLKCQESDFPPHNTLAPVQFDNQIFPVLEQAINNLFTSFQEQQGAKIIKLKLEKIVEKIYQVLNQCDISLIDQEAKERVIKVITTVPSYSYKKDMKTFWNNFLIHKNINILLTDIDKYFQENGQYSEIEIQPIHKIIQRHDIKLICYQWFKPS